MRLPINAIDILGWRRVEDSSLGDFPMPPETLLSIPDLFLGDEVCLFSIPRQACVGFADSFIYLDILGVAVDDNPWIRNYSDCYALRRSIDWVKMPRKGNRRASTAAHDSVGLRPSSRTDGDALVRDGDEELAANIRDSSGRPTMSSIEPCGDIDYGQDHAAHI